MVALRHDGGASSHVMGTGLPDVILVDSSSDLDLAGAQGDVSFEKFQERYQTIQVRASPGAMQMLARIAAAEDGAVHIIDLRPGQLRYASPSKSPSRSRSRPLGGSPEDGGVFAQGCLSHRDSSEGFTPEEPGDFKHGARGRRPPSVIGSPTSTAAEQKVVSKVPSRRMLTRPPAHPPPVYSPSSPPRRRKRLVLPPVPRDPPPVASPEPSERPAKPARRAHGRGASMVDLNDCLQATNECASARGGEPEAEPPGTLLRPKTQRSSIGLTVQPPAIRRHDLHFLAELGSGAFGCVSLQEDVRTGSLYALKALSKGKLAMAQMQESVLREKSILEATHSPFIIQLLETYNGSQHVYFLLEAALGGELFTIYETLDLYGSEPHARYYAGCVLEAFDHLHSRSILYRDLKPENLVLDTAGRCKLTDMGLAKVLTGKTFTKVGTPDYMAPEVFNCTGQTVLVDWWALGVLIFELLAGQAPFEADDAEETYRLAELGMDHVVFPESASEAAQSMAKGLCQHNPQRRLPAAMGLDGLRAHEFFCSMDWNALRAQTLEPPYVPNVSAAKFSSENFACNGERPTFVHYNREADALDWYSSFGPTSPRDSA